MRPTGYTRIVEQHPFNQDTNIRHKLQKLKAKMWSPDQYKENYCSKLAEPNSETRLSCN
jgi:hypothetical protein